MKLLPRPKVIAFDCYRTLFQNDPADWERMFTEICLDQRLPVPAPELWDRWKKYEVNFRTTRLNLSDLAGSPPFKTYRQAWSECFQRVFADTGADGDPAAAASRCISHMACRPPFPETVAALSALASLLPLAVLSNADEDFLRPCLSQSPVTFTAIESSESARWYKPAPGAFRRLLDVLKVEPGQVWYVGDHLHEDVYGSRSAGMVPVWINRPAGSAYYWGQVGLNAKHHARPAAEISDLTELVGLLDGAGAGSDTHGEIR
jgi:2-haloalkanoic acid dehalogenase type II